MTKHKQCSTSDFETERPFAGLSRDKLLSRIDVKEALELSGQALDDSVIEAYSRVKSVIDYLGASPEQWCLGSDGGSIHDMHERYVEVAQNVRAKLEPSVFAVNNSGDECYLYYCRYLRGEDQYLETLSVIKAQWSARDSNSNQSIAVPYDLNDVNHEVHAKYQKALNQFSGDLLSSLIFIKFIWSIRWRLRRSRSR